MAFSCGWNTSTNIHGKCSPKKSGKKHTTTIALLGSPEAGKADILCAYTNGSYQVTERPDHLRVVSMTAINGNIVKVCDTQGDIKLPNGSTTNKKHGKTRRVSCSSNSDAVGLVAVYSVEDKGSLEEAVTILQGHIRAGSRFNGMLLVGTWNGIRPNKRNVTFKQGKDMAEAIGVSFKEVACNNDTRKTIQEMIRELIDLSVNDWERKSVTATRVINKKQKLSLTFIIKPVLTLLRREDSVSKAN